LIGGKNQSSKISCQCPFNQSVFRTVHPGNLFFVYFMFYSKIRHCDPISGCFGANRPMPVSGSDVRILVHLNLLLIRWSPVGTGVGTVGGDGGFPRQEDQLEVLLDRGLVHQENQLQAIRIKMQIVEDRLQEFSHYFIHIIRILTIADKSLSGALSRNTCR